MKVGDFIMVFDELIIFIIVNIVDMKKLFWMKNE
jgi:hypothetical protein